MAIELKDSPGGRSQRDFFIGVLKATLKIDGKIDAAGWNEAVDAANTYGAELAREALSES